MYRSLTVLLCSILLLVGCARNDDGRYSISGNVSIDGKPVPVGEISFEPDGKSGNIGPASFTPIRDGKYSVERDNGVIGGKYTVTITGFDGVAVGEASDGKELLKRPYSESIDLPKADSTRDFDVKTKK
jgi:major membrane immunogen (membrane-anchored lipoprotein)